MLLLPPVSDPAAGSEAGLHCPVDSSSSLGRFRERGVFFFFWLWGGSWRGGGGWGGTHVRVTSVYFPGLGSAWSGEAARVPGGAALSRRGDLRLGASLNLQEVPGGLTDGLLTRV